MDPFTIAAGISALGSVFKGVTSFLGGNQQAKAEKAAAAQAEGEAGVAATQALQAGNATAAQGAVNAAASGGGGFSGTTIGAIQQLSSSAMFNARAAAYRGATEGQADLYKASVAKGQGLSSLVGGVIGAAGDVAGGVARSDLETKQDSYLSSFRNHGGMLLPPTGG